MSCNGFIAHDESALRRMEGHKSVASFLTAGQEEALKHLLDDPAMQESLGNEHAMLLSSIAFAPSS